MELQEFQKKVLESFSKMDDLTNRSKHTKQSAFIHLTEEVGEIARQITHEVHRPEKFDKDNLGTELADVLMFIVYLAHLYDIDLDKEMQAAIARVHKKVAKHSKA